MLPGCYEGCAPAGARVRLRRGLCGKVGAVRMHHRWHFGKGRCKDVGNLQLVP